MLQALVAGILLVGGAGAQAPVTAPAAPVQEETKPIDPVNVIVESDRALGELARIESLLSDSTAQDTMQKRLGQLSTRQDEVVASPWGTKPETLSARARNMYLDVWTQVVQSWNVWADDLDKRLAELQVNRERVRKIHETWKLTINQGAEAGISPVLQERAQSVIDRCRKLDTLYLGKLDELNKLHASAERYTSAAKDQLQQFQLQNKEDLSNLMALDSPPLWRAFVVSNEDGLLRQELNQSIAFLTRDTRTLVELHMNAVVLSAALLLALTMLFLTLSRRSHRWFSEPGMERTVKLLSTPFAISALIALLFFDLMVPTRLLDVRGLIMAVLTLRIMHGVLGGRARRTLYQSVALYLLMELTALIEDFSLLERLLVLGISAATLWFLVGFTRGMRRRAENAGRWWKVSGLMATLAMPLVVASMIANVFGNQSLAYLLIAGVVKSIFLAVVVATLVMILETLAVSVSRIPRIAATRLVSKHGSQILTIMPRFLRFSGALLFAGVSMNYFKILQIVEQRLHAMLTFRIQVGSLDISAMDLILFVAALYLSVLLSRAVRFVLEEEVFPRVDMPRGLPNTVSMLVNYGILALGFIVAVSAAGLDLSRFAILAGALGVGIGFGMQNVVNNFISGIILAFERPIQVGDTIEVGQLVGRVRRIGFRSSTVRTYEGAEVIVPNGNLISAEVVNWTLSDRLRRIDIAVGVAYGSDPAKVLELLLAVAEEHEEILSHPPPSIIFLGFGESSLDFSARVWTSEFEEWLRIRSDLSVKIYRALTQAGIEIPFPQRDLHLRSVDKEIVLSPVREGLGPGSLAPAE